jgi:hypothetical protein
MPAEQNIEHRPTAPSWDPGRGLLRWHAASHRLAIEGIHHDMATSSSGRYQRPLTRDEVQTDVLAKDKDGQVSDQELYGLKEERR